MTNFASPLFLALLLLLPLLATAAAVAARLGARRWAAFVADRLRQHLIERGSPFRHWAAFALLLLALGLLILTLARPQGMHGTRTEKILGRNVLIALDLSRSMKTPDVQPDRLTQAKTACYELLDALPNDRIGLLGFAGSAYLVAPLTVDHAAVRETIAEIDTDWIPTGGSNLYEGLKLGIDTLKKTGAARNALLLMSDGEEHVGRVENLAEQARAAGIQIIAIGFGTREGDFVPDSREQDGRLLDRSGREVISRLESAPLEKIARETNGRFIVSSSGADLPNLVRATISDLEQADLGSREVAVTSELFQWFLLPAILLLLTAAVVATRWRGAGAVAVALLLFMPTPLRALSLGEAKRAMNQERFEEAANLYQSLAEREAENQRAFRFRLGEGEAAYLAHDWDKARSAFSEALRSRDPAVRSAAHQGLGNTLFESGWARLADGLPYPQIPSPEVPKDPQNNPFQPLSDALIDPPKPEENGERVEFERMVKARLAEWMEEGQEGQGEEGKMNAMFHSLLSDWVDAAKHYGAADGADAAHNRELTLSHLDKIREILRDVEDRAQQIQSTPQSGEGEQGDQQPQPGDGQGDPDQQGEEGDQKQQDRQDGQGEDGAKRNQQGGQEDKPEEQPKPEEKQDDKSMQPKPGETPEEAARRILNENADLQKGAINPGRNVYRKPDKDW